MLFQSSTSAKEHDVLRKAYKRLKKFGFSYYGWGNWGEVLVAVPQLHLQGGVEEFNYAKKWTNRPDDAQGSEERERTN